MIKYIKSIDSFGRNIILVFIGMSLLNFLNFLYQVLIAHRLSPIDFSAFNSLLSIFMLISAPLQTIQPAIAKYSSEFIALGQISKIKSLLSAVFRTALYCCVISFFVFWFSSSYILDKLKINSAFCGPILAAMVALAWITPIFLGGIQGIESFKWFNGVTVMGSALKLLLAFILVSLGFNVAGALGAFLISGLIALPISVLPLKHFFTLRKMQNNSSPSAGELVDFNGFFLYFFPVAVCSFCFVGLTNMDMIMVKYYFLPQGAGQYALAQMVGKIFLFLPLAISVVMFPMVSRLKAKNMDTAPALRRALIYAVILSTASGLFYNLFPALSLKILTGHASSDVILLGRLFGISMTFFALAYILTSYFLSLKDFRFIKYIVLFTVLQFLAISFFHKGLNQVQAVMCVNSLVLFLVLISLTFRKPRQNPGILF